MCETVVEMGKHGKSRTQMANALDVARQQLIEWEQKFPDFHDAMTRATQFSLDWWEHNGQSGIWSREFNANAYRLQVINRFPNDFKDKREIETTVQTIGDDSDPRLTARAIVNVIGDSAVAALLEAKQRVIEHEPDEAE